MARRQFESLFLGTAESHAMIMPTANNFISKESRKCEGLSPQLNLLGYGDLANNIEENWLEYKPFA
jgi:hypothetical protein